MNGTVEPSSSSSITARRLFMETGRVFETCSKSSAERDRSSGMLRNLILSGYPLAIQRSIESVGASAPEADREHLTSPAYAARNDSISQKAGRHVVSGWSHSKMARDGPGPSVYPNCCLQIPQHNPISTVAMFSL